MLISKDWFFFYNINVSKEPCNVDSNPDYVPENDPVPAILSPLFFKGTRKI